jgi:hypothetical protein
MAWAKAGSTRRDHCQLICVLCIRMSRKCTARVGRRREALTAALRALAHTVKNIQGHCPPSSTTLLLTVSFIPKVQPIL